MKESIKNKIKQTMIYAIWKNRKLVTSLGKSDFKQRFSGSFFGIVWAFIQPIVTVLVYWFVFQKGLKVGASVTKAGLPVPFVLWLIAGIVPWFYFSEALNGGANALLDYSYLVKKVVFEIKILPVVKIMSAFFVHVFFVFFALVLFACYGYTPDLYSLQVIYYSLSMAIFVLGISYLNSAIIIFFRDLGQIINIILQIGVWMTPIMWNMDTMELPGWLITILKLNPMYYIVNGYRDALIDKIYFWERPKITLYYWAITILVFWLGSRVFKKLRVHFADVL